MNSDDKRMARGGHGSHWDGCEEVHWDCRIKTLEEEVARLRERAAMLGEINAEMCADILGLQTIVDRLDTTNDGAPIVPSGDYWCVFDYPWNMGSEDEATFISPCHMPRDEDERSLGKKWIVTGCEDEECRVIGVYSTRAAAEAAKP